MVQVALTLIDGSARLLSSAYAVGSAEKKGSAAKECSALLSVRSLTVGGAVREVTAVDEGIASDQRNWCEIGES